MKVNFVDLASQYAVIKNDVLADTEAVLSTGGFIGSQEFEEKFSAFHGKKYCVGVGSGTDALWLSLLALGIGIGDEVIVPSNTYIASAFAISHTGATPVFVDPNPETYVIDVDSIRSAITDKTKAIMPVHLYGHPVNMTKLMSFVSGKDIFVVEDCAQSVGALCLNKKTGTFGDVGCYSFYPAKNLGGLGQGGAIVTDNERLAIMVRELGNVGRSEGSWFDYIHKGFNSRLDALNAKFLSRGLNCLDTWNNARVNSAVVYSDLLDGAPVVTPQLPTDDLYPVFHLYEIKCQSEVVRDELKAFLGKKEIACGLHYPIPCHRQPVYKELFTECPISDELSKTLLSLPIHPGLKYSEVVYVSEAICEFFDK